MEHLNYNSINPEYAFYTLENKIKIGFFKTKDDLINEINKLKNYYKKNGIDLSLYSEKIENLLKLFDKNNKNSIDFSQLKEHTLSDGSKEATMKINDTNVTIKNGNSNKSIKEEINDSYNKNLAHNLDSKQNNSIEENFNRLRKFTHNEDYMTSNSKIDSSPIMSNVSSNINILLEYAENYHIVNPEFSKDGKMRDQNGNIYELIMLSDGTSKINITKNISYNDTEASTKTTRTLSNYTKNETMKKANLHSNNILSLTEFITYLTDNYENIDEILNDYNISENQQQIYKNLAYEEYEKIKEAQKMENNNQKEKPKVYQYKKNEGRNGFVNAFLLTIITTLFGGLCLTYMVSSIIKIIG